MPTPDPVRWGIVGCGDVTEVMSGPALQKAARSTVTACMRRDGDKARDYAARHGIATAHDDANALIDDPQVDAVYIATPPDSHPALATKAMEAGKPVFVEKPMALTVAECEAMTAASKATGQPLIVAYYRRALPRFEAFREVVQDGTIGVPCCVEVRQFKRSEDRPNQAWKLDPAVCGGGHFADMQSHVLDWLDHTFGPANSVAGQVRRQSGAYAAEDLVAYTIGYETVVASGLFAYATDRIADHVTVFGSKGSARTSFFSPAPLVVKRDGTEKSFDMPNPTHTHLPLTERVIGYLLDGAPNPCSPETATRSIKIVEVLYRGCETTGTAA